MSEVSGMMRDGTLCASCATAISWNYKPNGDGTYSNKEVRPLWCKDCQKDLGIDKYGKAKVTKIGFNGQQGRMERSYNR